jgi:hypothetical protein
VEGNKKATPSIRLPGFVSEKSAALEVVKKRLEQNGIHGAENRSRGSDAQCQGQ